MPFVLTLSLSHSSLEIWGSVKISFSFTLLLSFNDIFTSIKACRKSRHRGMWIVCVSCDGFLPPVLLNCHDDLNNKFLATQRQISLCTKNHHSPFPGRRRKKLSSPNFIVLHSPHPHPRLHRMQMGTIAEATRRKMKINFWLCEFVTSRLVSFHLLKIFLSRAQLACATRQTCFVYVTMMWDHIQR